MEAEPNKQSEDYYPYQGDDFVEADYDQLDRHLAADEEIPEIYNSPTSVSKKAFHPKYTMLSVPKFIAKLTRGVLHSAPMI